MNSSIAYLHASRRHRLLASRELRLLKLETDALRRELNDWRNRASIRRIEEPTRSDAFSFVLSGELEILPVEGLDNEDGEEGEDDNSDHPFDAPSATSGPMQSSRVVYTPYPMQHQMPGRPPMTLPMIASPGGMAVENPAAAAAYNAMGGVSEPFSAFNEVDPVMQYRSFERQKSSFMGELPHENRKYLEQGWNDNNMLNSGMSIHMGMGNDGVPFGM